MLKYSPKLKLLCLLNGCMATPIILAIVLSPQRHRGLDLRSGQRTVPRKFHLRSVATRPLPPAFEGPPHHVDHPTHLIQPVPKLRRTSAFSNSVFKTAQYPSERATETVTPPMQSEMTVQNKWRQSSRVKNSGSKLERTLGKIIDGEATSEVPQKKFCQNSSHWALVYNSNGRQPHPMSHKFQFSPSRNLERMVKTVR